MTVVINGGKTANIATAHRRCLGDRNYEWFGILSNVRGEEIDEIGQIAKDGLPEDVSAHTRLCFDDDNHHSLGWFTIPMLEQAANDIRALEDDAEKYQDKLEIITYYLDLMHRILNNKEAYFIRTDNILFGPEIDYDTEERFPEMRAESNHARIRRERRIGDLLPLKRDTIRFCIAYDS